MKVQAEGWPLHQQPRKRRPPQHPPTPPPPPPPRSQEGVLQLKGSRYHSSYYTLLLAAALSKALIIAEAIVATPSPSAAAARPLPPIGGPTAAGQGNTLGRALAFTHFYSLPAEVSSSPWRRGSAAAAATTTPRGWRHHHHSSSWLLSRPPPLLGQQHQPQVVVAAGRTRWLLVVGGGSGGPEEEEKKEDGGGGVDEEEEDPCACSDLGRAEAGAQRVQLRDVCSVGDVIIMLLSEEDRARFNDGATTALAVVDSEEDERVTFLCQRNPDSNEWYRDSREEEGRCCAGSAVVKVLHGAYYSQRCIPSLGGGQGYGAEAEDCWLLQDEDQASLAGDSYQCRRPVDLVGTAPWMQT